MKQAYCSGIKASFVLQFLFFFQSHRKLLVITRAYNRQPISRILKTKQFCEFYHSRNTKRIEYDDSDRISGIFIAVSLSLQTRTIKKKHIHLLDINEK